MEGQLAATPNTNSIHDANHALDGPLLPENVACMVTAASFTARLSLRCSSIFLDALFEAAKYGTVLSLGLSRNALTNALSTAKNIHDTSPKSICSSAITEQEERNGLFVQLLEKYTDIGLHIVSHTFSLAELFAISGLQFTSRTIQSSLKVAEESVRIIDGIFGSNDTSRAIASIITLVHRELVQDPEFGLAKAGKIAILAGLTKALTAFAVLQNVTHKRMMKHIPMTVLWEGLVTDEKEDQIKQNNSLIQFKNKTHCNENRLILQRLLNKEEQESDALVCDNHAYKVAAETTCLTTKTISIGSSHLKKITVNTNQEKNAAYLAMLYQNSRLLLSALTERQYRRKIERPDNQPVYHHQRRFSSPGDYSGINFDLSTLTAFRPCLTPIQKKSSYRNNDMDNIMYYDHGWNFPQTHIVHNIAHFMRYASAAYGESFMRILGIGDIPTVLPNSHHHHPNHHAFAHHTGNSVEDILLSSYTNRSPLYLHNPSIHALVHYVTVDHAAKAIVLTCRGTLGLSDLLTDLSFDYTDFNLPSESTKFFKAHSGMLDAAQLLAKEKGEVYQKIRQGLQSYPDYGLVMCGHSLGGGVASLLCVLWSQQIKRDQGNKRLPSFVTSNQSGLPAGRPIHCYAYGPPGVMSLELSNYCAGLVTSVVYGYDIVSSLSWGILKDFKNIATSLHTEADVAEEIIARVIGRMQEQNYKNEDELNEDDQWFWAMIKTMRADMTAEKMYPPSIVYSIETIPHVKEQHKVVLYRCDDVQARFSEIVFSKTMFMDHSPLMYERAIKKLCRSFTESFSE